jgi:hypothetical protein
MNDSTRERLLKAALVVFGVIFLLVYPLGLVWPSGWVWHGGEGKYYLQMICGICRAGCISDQETPVLNDEARD